MKFLKNALNRLEMEFLKLKPYKNTKTPMKVVVSIRIGKDGMKRLVFCPRCRMQIEVYDQRCSICGQLLEWRGTE